MVQPVRGRGRRRVGVALMLEGPAADEVQGLRRALGDRSIARIDPHLTLIAPLNLGHDDGPAALAVLRRAAAGASPVLELTIGPVATFAPANPVLYLAVGGDLAALERLRQAVLVAPLVRPSTWPWVPHVTVADDVDDQRLPAALAALGSYHLPISIDRVVLLELRGTRWSPLADVALGPPSRVGTGGVALELTRSRMLDPEGVALVDAAGAAEARPAAEDVPAPAVRAEDVPAAEAVPAGEVVPAAGVPQGLEAEGRSAPVVITARRGMIACGVGAAWLDDRGGHLGVVVAAPERGQGVGRHLVAALESAVADAGWDCGVLQAVGPAAFYRAVSARSRVADYSKATDA